MRKAAAASRYASYDSPSPSPSPSSSRRHVAPTVVTAGDGSRALVVVRSGRGDLCCLPPPQPQSHNDGNLGCVLRRLISMDKKPSTNPKLPVPPAAIAPAKNSGGGAKLPGLSRKLLFQKGASDGKKKALAEVRNGGNGNTRTLAMVLCSERELLSQSKEQARAKGQGDGFEIYKIGVFQGSSGGNIVYLCGMCDTARGPNE